MVLQRSLGTGATSPSTTAPRQLMAYLRSTAVRNLTLLAAPSFSSDSTSQDKSSARGRQLSLTMAATAPIPMEATHLLMTHRRQTTPGLSPMAARMAVEADSLRLSTALMAARLRSKYSETVIWTSAFEIFP